MIDTSASKSQVRTLKTQSITNDLLWSIQQSQEANLIFDLMVPKTPESFYCFNPSTYFLVTSSGLFIAILSPHKNFLVCEYSQNAIILYVYFNLFYRNQEPNQIIQKYVAIRIQSSCKTDDTILNGHYNLVLKIWSVKSVQKIFCRQWGKLYLHGNLLHWWSQKLSHVG